MIGSCFKSTFHLRESSSQPLGWVEPANLVCRRWGRGSCGLVLLHTQKCWAGVPAEARDSDSCARSQPFHHPAPASGDKSLGASVYLQWPQRGAGYRAGGWLMFPQVKERPLEWGAEIQGQPDEQVSKG